MYALPRFVTCVVSVCAMTSLFTSCKKYENWIGYFWVYTQPPAGVALRIGASTFVGANSCVVRMADDGRTVEILVEKDRFGFEGADARFQSSSFIESPVEHCILEIEQKPELWLETLRYYGSAHCQIQGAGGHEMIEVDLVSSGNVFVPRLGWNRSNQVYCREERNGAEIYCNCANPDEDAGPSEAGIEK